MPMLQALILTETHIAKHLKTPGFHHFIIELTFFNLSLQEYTQQCKLMFDLIVCNPPYFENKLKPLNTKQAKAKHKHHTQL